MDAGEDGPRLGFRLAADGAISTFVKVHNLFNHFRVSCDELMRIPRRPLV